MHGRYEKTGESNEIILVWPWIVIICPWGAEVLYKCITSAHAEVLSSVLFMAYWAESRKILNEKRSDFNSVHLKTPF